MTISRLTAAVGRRLRLQSGRPGRRHHRLLSSAAALLAVGTIVVVRPAGAGAPAALDVVTNSYVALGDSFTSGPAIAAQLGPGTTPSAPSACQRSSANYPSLTARALGLDLTDMSCAGATTADLTGSQGAGIPPQLSALNQFTSIVTLGIGGNDLGYSSIVANCAALTPWGPTRVGWSCRNHYTAGGVDQLEGDIAGVGAKVAAVLGDIRARAPFARVFVIGYPDVVPPAGSGCWPDLPFTASDLSYLRGVEVAFNATLAAEAASADDLYVDVATPSALHSACAPSAVRWVEPVFPTAGTYPLHPDALGMAGMAEALEAAMAANPRA